MQVYTERRHIEVAKVYGTLEDMAHLLARRLLGGDMVNPSRPIKFYIEGEEVSPGTQIEIRYHTTIRIGEEEDEEK